MSVLITICARGGSKGIPGKNIKLLNGKPLIAWSIEAGLNSKYVDRVIVSTDDIEIAKISEKWGADIPFIRPKELATDTATTVDTVIHALQYVETHDEKYDFILLLQPTSPLRNSIHVDESIEIVINKEMNGITGVTEVSHPYEWTNTLSDNLSMNEFISKEAYFTRSQDFPKRYQINGAIYMLNKYSLMLDKKMIPDKNSMAYIMDKKSSVDIDTEDDFLLASFYLQINS